MRDVDELDHYDVLEVAARRDGATRSSAPIACCSATCADDSLATYSMFGEEEAEALRDRIEPAYRVLSDPDARRAYDAARSRRCRGGAERRAGRARDARAARRRPRSRSRSPSRAPRGAHLRSHGRRRGGRVRRQRPSGTARACAARGCCAVSRSKTSRRATKISPAYLRFLEEERFDDLPAVVYVRGFVAAYARCLGLDADQRVAQLRARASRSTGARSRRAVACSGGAEAADVDALRRRRGRGRAAARPGARGARGRAALAGARWIDEGRVRVRCVARARGVAARRRGSAIEAEPPEPMPLAAAPEPIPLAVLYEDADLIVIDKPAGLVVHPAPGHAGGTLVNALLHHCRDLAGIGGVLRPGHRAPPRSRHVGRAGRRQERRRARGARRAVPRPQRSSACTSRWCAACPAPSAGRVERAIGRHPRDRKRMSRAARDAAARRATHWRVRAALPRSAASRCSRCGPPAGARTRSACTSRRSGCRSSAIPSTAAVATRSASSGRRCTPPCSASRTRRAASGCASRRRCPADLRGAPRRARAARGSP